MNNIRKTPRWRKLLALWLVACFTLFSIPFTGVYADEPQLPANLLKNGDFEDPVGPPNDNDMPLIPYWDPWTPGGASSAEVVSGGNNVFSGNNALKLTITQPVVNSYTGYSQRWRNWQGSVIVPIGEERTFYLTFWIKGENIQAFGSGSIAGVRVQYQDPDGDPVKSNEIYGSLLGTGTTDWTKVSVALTAPPELGRLVVEPMLRNATGSIWFDNFWLTTEPLPADYGEYGEIDPEQATFDLDPSKQEDIVVNVSFNGTALRGIFNGTYELVRDTDYTISGNVVTIKKEYLATLAKGVYSIVFSFSAGEDRTLTVEVKETGSGLQPVVRQTVLVNFRSASGAPSPWNNFINASGQTTGSISNLVNTAGEYTGWSLAGDVKNQTSQIGVPQTTGDAAWVDHENVRRSAHLTTNNAGEYSVLTISGLNNAYLYNIEVFSSCPNPRVTVWVVNDGEPRELECYDPGLGTNVANTTRTLKFTNVSPINGQIIVKYAKSERSNGTAYANAMKIEEIGLEDPGLGSGGITFDRNPANHDDVSININFSGRTLAGIFNGSELLQQGTDYTVTENGVVISKNYLSAQLAGKFELEFRFTSGETLFLPVTIIDTSDAPEGREFTWIFEQNFDKLPDYQGKDDLPPNYGGFTHKRNSNLSFIENAFEVTGKDPEMARGGTGKAAVFYRESRDTQPDLWTTDGILSKLFEEGYEDVFVQFYIKFQPGWTESGAAKLFRISHYDGTGDFYGYGTNRYNAPLFIWDWSNDNYGVRNALSVRGDPQETNYYMQNPYPVGLTRQLHNGDMSLNFESNILDLNGDGYNDNPITMIDRTTGQTLQPVPITDHEQIYGSEWNLVQFRIKMNSAPGEMDGILQQWINGQKTFENTQIPWQGSDSPGGLLWNAISFGGNDYFTYYPESQKVSEWHAIDDIRIGIGGLPKDLYNGEQSRINPARAAFDKNVQNRQDVPVGIQFNGNTLTDIYCRGSKLAEGTDYTVTASGVTLKKEYLATLPTGKFYIGFYFSAGASQTLEIEITDTTDYDQDPGGGAAIDGAVEIIGTPPDGIKIEGEDFDYQSGGSVNFGGDGSAQWIYGWDNAGHLLRWSFTIPEGEEGEYRIMMRYATNVDNAIRTLRIDGSEIAYRFQYPRSGGWSTFVNGLLKNADNTDLTFELSAGEHTLTMVNISDGRGLNVDYIVLVKSGDSGEDEPFPFVIEAPVFKNLSGQVITTLASERFVMASVRITNNSSKAREALLIVALYDSNNAIKNISFLSRNVAAGQTDEFTAGFNLPQDITGHTVKVFVWNSLEDMQPLSDVVMLQ